MAEHNAVGISVGPIDAPPYQEHQSNNAYPPQAYHQDSFNAQTPPGQIQPVPAVTEHYGNKEKYENQNLQGQPQYQGHLVNSQVVQPVGNPRQYQTATPLINLGPGPAPVDCPACGVRALTRIEYEAGNTTFAWAAGLCICIGLGCIPFCMNSTKDVVHYCGHEGTRLATWHRSGVTEVHAHA